MKPTMHHGVIAIVHPEGMLHDTSGVNEINDLEAELEILIGNGTTQIVADLTDVEHVASGGLGPLIHAHNKLATRSGRFALVGLNPRVMHLLVVTKLRLVFEVFTTVDDAVRAFEGHTPSARLFIERSGGIPVLMPTGALVEGALVVYLTEEVEHVATTVAAPRVIVDCGGITSIDDAGIIGLVEGRELCQQYGGDLSVVIQDGPIREAINAHEHGKGLTLFRRVEEATAGFTT